MDTKSRSSLTSKGSKGYEDKFEKGFESGPQHW